MMLCRKHTRCTSCGEPLTFKPHSRPGQYGERFFYILHKRPCPKWLGPFRNDCVPREGRRA